MKEVTLYTDGACSFNPGPGGWGCVLICNGVEKEFSGFEENTTNNRMELTAVIEGLKKLKEPCYVALYSDSAYIVNACALGWLQNWIDNGWKTSNKDKVKNQDLWEEIYKLMQVHSIVWCKVKGHANNVYNNRCDELARKQVDNYLDSKKYKDE